MSYSTVGSFRERLGSCGEGYSNRVLQALLDGATAFIDEVTGWFFEARSLVIDIDGRGSEILLVPLPIISITKVEFIDEDYETSTSEIDLPSLAIYNRHLSGLTNPDDRMNPKIAWRSSYQPGVRFFEHGEWTEGFQNVRLTGVFGFTEYNSDAGRSIATDAGDAITAPDKIKMVNGAFTAEDIGRTITIAGSSGGNDGDYTVEAVTDSQNIVVTEQTLNTEANGFTATMSADPQWGRTPTLILDLCERLAMRDLPAVPGMASGSIGDPIQYERRMREMGRVIREKVRDQEIAYSAANASEGGNVTGRITGDPYIDMMLFRYMKPADMSWV